MNDETKKNILDLQFQKYLIIASTSVIIFFTYIIGVGITVLTKQINLNSITPGIYKVLRSRICATSR